MGGLILKRGGAAPSTVAGFTLIETMVAMGLAMTVLLANLYMINVAHRNLAQAKVLTEATNIAADTLSVLKTRTLAEINATTDNVAGGLVIGTHVDDPNQAPLSPSDPGNLLLRQKVGHNVYSRRWTVAHVDSDGNGAADLAGDLVKITIEVTSAASRSTRVAMTTLTTGRAP